MEPGEAIPVEWLCWEKLAAVSMGCVGLAAADLGTASGGLIAGVGLVDLWRKTRHSKGLESQALLDEQRRRVSENFREWARNNDVSKDDIRAANMSMEQHLADCVPSTEELAKTAFIDADWPTYVAHLIVDRLADRNICFAENSVAASPLMREFALLTVTAALQAAKNQEPYMRRLTEEIVLLLPQHLTRIESKVETILEGQSETNARLIQLTQQFETIARERGVHGDTLIALARMFVEKVDDPQQAAQILEENIGIYLAMLGGREQASNFGAADDEALQRVLDLIEAEDFSGAVKQGEAEYHRLDAAERELANQMSARKLRMARTNMDAAQLAFDVAGVARWIGEKTKVEAGTTEINADALRAEQLAWYEKSRTRGSQFDMAVSAELARMLIATAGSRDARAQDRNNLAICLRKQAEWIGGETARTLLAEAIDELRKALREQQQDGNLIDQTSTQANLGVALRQLSELTQGAEGNELSLEAVETLRKAAATFHGQNRTFDHAMCQFNLSNALQTQARRRGGMNGLILLTRAFDAMRYASILIDRDEHTEEWGQISAGLGGLLLRIAEPQSDREYQAKLVDDAIAALEEARQARKRVGYPYQLALTENNLGAALSIQGVRKRDMLLLDRAITAFQAALQVRTPDALPLEWAQSTAGLSFVYENLADLEPSRRCDYLFFAQSLLLKIAEKLSAGQMGSNTRSMNAALTRIKASIAEHCPG